MNRFNEQIKFLARKSLVQQKRRDVDASKLTRRALESRQSIRTLIPNENKQNAPVSSIRVLHPEGHQHFSGILHLLTRNSLQRYPEKKHLQEPAHTRPLPTERKHDYDFRSVKEHTRSYRDQSTLNEKIKNDLKSQLSAEPFAREVTASQSNRKKFLNAVEIDTNLRARRISSQKIKELSGNGLESQPQGNFGKTRRDDFLRSSFRLG